ncbi:hypothetical protein T35B1_15581 [Salinisphaera shabanensis T35B1]
MFVMGVVSFGAARRRWSLLLLVWVVLAVSACEWTDLIDGDEDGDENDATPPAAETNIPGLSVAVSTRGFDTTRDALLDAIGSRGNLATRASVDHQANAEDTNLSLRPTTVVFVSDGNRERALIAADPRVALDLPARVLLYRDSDGDVGVGFSNAAYLAARYDLNDAENSTLDALDDDLEAIATEAANADLETSASAAGIAEGEGIETVASDDDFNTVVNRLDNAIGSRDALTLIDTINFQSGNTGIGPSTLFIFGNPNAGTPLMRSNQTVGIDLPQKMLVALADDGTVTIYYNDPAFIADRHDIDNRDDEIDTIADLLDEIAGEAAGTPSSNNTDTNVDNTADDGNAESDDTDTNAAENAAGATTTGM